MVLAIRAMDRITRSARTRYGMVTITPLSTGLAPYPGAICYPILNILDAYSTTTAPRKATVRVVRLKPLIGS